MQDKQMAISAVPYSRRAGMTQVCLGYVRRGLRVGLMLAVLFWTSWDDMEMVIALPDISGRNCKHFI